MASSSSKVRSVIFHPALLCAVALAACVAASHPVLEMGLNDDWSYIWIARTLANTGHIVYNGWATPMLGWQLYLGALFIKVFGFSFTVVRSSMLVVSLGTAILLQRLFTRFGATPGNATIATLTLVLSPLFLPLSFSFMSDVPGFFCILLCLYLCVRAIQAETNRAALLWLAAAVATNTLGGTARQFAWLGVLVVVPCTAWCMRRRPGALLTAALLWIASVIAIFAMMHWFAGQPYSITDNSASGSTDHVGVVERAVSWLRTIMAICLFSLPIMIAFFFKPRSTDGRPRKHNYITLGLFGVAAACLLFAAHHFLARGANLRWLTPFSNNYVTARGLLDIPAILGQRPDVVPPYLRALIVALGAAAVAGLLLYVGRSAHSLFAGNSAASATPPRQHSAENRLSGTTVLMLLGPYTLTYIGMLLIRDQIYDRYLLPVLFVLLVFLVRFYQEKVSQTLPAASSLLVVLFAAFAVAGMHDLYAMDRARLTAANEIRAAGVPRSAIRAGFEYDSWTELELTGYVNDSRLLAPAGAYHPEAVADLSNPCLYWFSEHLVALKPRYGLSYDSNACYPASRFPPVLYRTWLAPRARAIYIPALP